MPVQVVDRELVQAPGFGFERVDELRAPAVEFGEGVVELLREDPEGAGRDVAFALGVSILAGYLWSSIFNAEIPGFLGGLLGGLVAIPVW